MPSSPRYPWHHLKSLFARIHRSETGAVSLETVLILGAIALPVLIFLIKFGWPQIRSMFENRTYDADRSIEAMKAGQ